MENDFKKIKSNELDNISITAYRIILILNMLLNMPCGDKEINQMLKEEIKGSRDLSNDTICIYLNTLRLLGCEISRPTKKNNYKYSLKAHPFKLSLTKDEITTLTELKKYISDLNEWKTALDVDNFYNKFLELFCPNTKELFLSIQKNLLLREVNSEQICIDIKQFDEYCNQNKILTLEYNSPESGKKDITLKVEKITMENGAFYLWGYNEELETSMYLRLERILSVKSINSQKNEIKKNSLPIRYKLTGNYMNAYTASENESIIAKNEHEIIIEEIVTNKFKFFQKILSYGRDCTILSPDEIRDELKTKLKKMFQSYNEISVA